MKSTWLDKARAALTQQVLGAKTVPEIAAARQALRDWLTVHPEEQGMRWGFEQLPQMQEIAETEEVTSAAPPPTAPVT